MQLRVILLTFFLRHFHQSNAERKGQSVRRHPLDFGHGQDRIGWRIEELAAEGVSIFFRRDLGQTHGVAMGEVCASGFVTGWAPFLHEDQHVALLQIGQVACQSGSRSPLGQATVRLAPGVKCHTVVGQEEGSVVHGLKDHGLSRKRLTIVR